MDRTELIFRSLLHLFCPILIMVKGQVCALNSSRKRRANMTDEQRERKNEYEKRPEVKERKNKRTKMIYARVKECLCDEHIGSMKEYANRI